MKKSEVLAVIYAACLNSVMNKKNEEIGERYDDLHERAMADAEEFCGRFFASANEMLDCANVVESVTEVFASKN